jgi:FKBP-type peptidyl-prolyl cis-trans isomerase SlyD
MKVSKDTVVSLDYTVHDDEGNLVDEGNEELVYLHGGHADLFPKLEAALDGCSEGDSVTVQMEPADAFGEYDAELMRVEPRDAMPADIYVGAQIEGASNDEDGTSTVKRLFSVLDVQEDRVVMDANHPLAGMTLVFNATVASVRTATAEEVAAGHAIVDATE